MFALIIHQMCKRVKRALSLATSPRESPPWLMSARTNDVQLPKPDVDQGAEVILLDSVRRMAGV
jgi:hypothetical protein